MKRMIVKLTRMVKCPRIQQSTMEALMALHLPAETIHDLASRARSMGISTEAYIISRLQGAI